MVRRLFNVVVAVSLVLCAAVVVGWVGQPEHTMCFSTGLPAGRLLVVSAQNDRLRVALWRDWPVWEWPAVHRHLRRSDFDFCGPLASETHYTRRDLFPGVWREDIVATYFLTDDG